MKVAEIVNPGEDTLLHHPTLGFVRWKPEFTGSESRLLVWAMGTEKDEPLVVDETVLFCDLWETTTESALQSEESS